MRGPGTRLRRAAVVIIGVRPPASAATGASPQRCEMTTASPRPSATPTASKFVYRFGNGQADGSAEMKDLLGGKGAGLAEMTNIGIPVPPGFTITTEVCTYFYANGQKYPPELKQQVSENLARVEG